MNDVRRHYGAMIARVFNSADNHVGNHFVRTFSSSFSPVRTHGYHSDFLQGISSHALCPTMQAIVYGSTATFSEWMQALMFLSQAIFPDLVCRVRNEQIVRRPRERRCTIVIDLELELAWTYDIDFLSLLHYAHMKGHRNQARSHEDTVLMCCPLQTPKALETPIRFSHVMRFVLKVDESKRIESFEVLHEKPPPYMMPLLDQARERSRSMGCATAAS